MKSVACGIIMLILILLTPRPGTASDTAQEAATIKSVVSGVIAAYGGKRTLEHLSSIYMEGHITAFAFDDQGTYTLYFERPRKLLLDIRYSRSREIRILNGDKGYYGTGSEPPSRVRGLRYLGILYQYKSQDIPYGLLTGAYELRYEGRDEVNGFPTEVLGLHDQEGPPMKIYVDRKTFLIRKISGLFSMEGSSMVLSSEFSDFKKVGVTVLPYKFTNFAGGQKIAETVVKKYRLNEPMEDSFFNPATPYHHR
ncbi:MAG: hypothetical protein P8Y63_06510 [Deltaproteobacteria bacterium]